MEKDSNKINLECLNYTSSKEFVCMDIFWYQGVMSAMCLGSEYCVVLAY